MLWRVVISRVCWRSPHNLQTLVDFSASLAISLESIPSSRGPKTEGSDEPGCLVHCSLLHRWPWRSPTPVDSEVHDLHHTSREHLLWEATDISEFLLFWSTITCRILINTMTFSLALPTVSLRAVCRRIHRNWSLWNWNVNYSGRRAVAFLLLHLHELSYRQT